MAIEFHDNSMKVKAAMDAAVIAYLHEAATSMQNQAAKNTRIGKGDTAEAWDYRVDEGNLEATVGNPLENAIWEEFGTGEYALHGDGRRGGWSYQDEDTGKWHHTYGKTPSRAFHNAFNTLKSALIRRAEEVLKARLKE